MNYLSCLGDFSRGKAKRRSAGFQRPLSAPSSHALFHPVVGRQGGQDFAGAPGLLPARLHAVDHDCIDIEATRRELPAIGFVLVDGYAGHIINGVCDT